MEHITTVTGLRNAIKVLEVEQSAQELLVKEQLHEVYESLRPVNIIRGTIKDLISFSTSSITGNLAGTAIGAAGGFLLKRLFVGSSGNIFRKLFGNILQLGVTNIASKKSESINSFGQSLLQRIFRKRESHHDD